MVKVKVRLRFRVRGFRVRVRVRFVNWAVWAFSNWKTTIDESLICWR